MDLVYKLISYIILYANQIHSHIHKQIRRNRLERHVKYAPAEWSTIVYTQQSAYFMEHARGISILFYAICADIALSAQPLPPRKQRGLILK